MPRLCSNHVVFFIKSEALFRPIRVVTDHPYRTALYSGVPVLKSRTVNRLLWLRGFLNFCFSVPLAECQDSTSKNTDRDFSHFVNSSYTITLSLIAIQVDTLKGSQVHNFPVFQSLALQIMAVLVQQQFFLLFQVRRRAPSPTRPPTQWLPGLLSGRIFTGIIFPVSPWPWDRLRVQKNEHQGYFLGSKGGRWVGLTTLPPSFV